MHRSIIFQGCCWEDLSRTISFLFSFFPMHYFFSLRKLEDALFTSSVLKFHNNVLGVGFFFHLLCRVLDEDGHFEAEICVFLFWGLFAHVFTYFWDLSIYLFMIYAVDDFYPLFLGSL